MIVHHGELRTMCTGPARRLANELDSESDRPGIKMLEDRDDLESLTAPATTGGILPLPENRDLVARLGLAPSLQNRS